MNSEKEKPNVLNTFKVTLIGETPLGVRLFRAQCYAGFVKIALSPDMGTEMYDSDISDEHIRNATLDAFRLDRRWYWHQSQGNRALD